MSNDYHAEGQKDYVEGEYDPPHTLTPLDGFIHNQETWDRMVQDNEQYNAGYENARDQDNG